MNNDNDLLLDPRVQVLLHEVSRLAIAQTAAEFADVVRTGKLSVPLSMGFCGLNSCQVDGKEVVGAHDLCLVLEVLIAGHRHLTTLEAERAQAWADAHPSMAHAIEEAVKE